MDYENILDEVAVRMAASQLSRYPRNSFGSTSRRWSGRVEKSRSSHTSPAIHERRRAHSSTRPVQAAIYEQPGFDYSMPQQRPMRVSRPFSWHPTTSQPLPLFNNVSQMESPALSSYLQTPPIPTNSTAPYQTMYPDFSTYQKSSEPTHMMAPSPVYSVDAYASNSPEWDYFYDGQTPVIADNMLPNSSPTYPGSWYNTNCSQVPHLPQPALHLPQLPPMHHQPSLSSMITHHQEAISIPPTISYAATGEPFRNQPVEKEEEGEVLVALGLYDLPDDSSVPIASGATMLKLTETWQPPSDDEDSSQEEDDDDDDEEVKTPGAGTSWFR